MQLLSRSFGVGVFAWSQLGAAVDSFYSVTYSMITLLRALFGDFNIDDIAENSRDVTNRILFLIYLFVAVFILLALFLSILGEAQSLVRDDQYAESPDEQENEFGVLAVAHDIVVGTAGAVASRVRRVFGFHTPLSATPTEEMEPETLNSAAERKLLIVKSLRAFKPKILDSVDQHLATFETAFTKAVQQVDERLHMIRMRSRARKDLLTEKGVGRSLERAGRDRRKKKRRSADGKPDSRSRSFSPDSPLASVTRQARAGVSDVPRRGSPVKSRPPRATSRNPLNMTDSEHALDC